MASTYYPNQRTASGIRGWWHSWEQFWFKPGDPTTLGFMRLLGGFLILYIHLSYSFDLQEFLGDNAWLRRDTANFTRADMPMASPTASWKENEQRPPQNERELRDMNLWSTPPAQVISHGRYIFSIWFHIGDPHWMWVAHISVLIVMFLFAVGFCTRVTGVLTWVAILSYINRSHISVFGMDTMMTILATYLVIGPSGAAFSVDRLIERRLAARRGTPLPPWQPAEPSVTANVAIRLCQVHFCIIYFMSGLSKLQGGAWWQGVATWGTMVNYEFSPMNSHLYMDFLRWISSKRWLWETFLTATSAMTLMLECSFALVVWNKKLRWLYVCGSAMFHVSIAFFMGLVCFSITMLVLLLCFVPGDTIREVLGGYFDSWRQARQRQHAINAPAAPLLQTTATAVHT